MRRLVAAIAILAAFAVHGASVGTAQFGDLGLNDNVVTNVDLSGLSMAEEDPTVPAWAKATNKPSYTANEVGVFLNSIGVTGAKILSVGLAELIIPSWAQQTEKPTYTATEVGATPASHADDFSNPHGVTCEQIDAAPASVTNEMAQMRAENALVYRLYQGSNVVAEVTNYNSSVHSPELRIMQLNESNEYVTVWTETNGLTRTFIASTNEAATMVQGERTRSENTYAPKAWSRTTSGLGVEAPSNTTWISTESTVIAGGLEPQKYITSGGEIWIVTANGMVADFHPLTNNTAFLDIASADGTSMFRIEKTDSYLVGVHVTNVTVDDNALVCGVDVLAEDHPLVRIKPTISAEAWSKEEDGIPSSLATVTWTGSSGNWTCRIANNTGGNSLFAYMEYMQQGGTKIVNNAAMDITQGIYVDGVKFVPSVSGNNLIWTKQP